MAQCAKALPGKPDDQLQFDPWVPDGRKESTFSLKLPSDLYTCHDTHAYVHAHIHTNTQVEGRKEDPQVDKIRVVTHSHVQFQFQGTQHPLLASEVTRNEQIYMQAKYS